MSSVFSGLASSVLPQNQDIAFGFEALAAPGAFVVTSFEGTETLFDTYAIEIQLASHDPDIDLSSLVDTDATLTIYDKYSIPRHFHGVIAEAEAGDTGFSRSYYSVVLKPALHRLQYTSDSRIFQEESVQDIISTILSEHGVPDVEWRVAESHAPREFCVQYNETHYAFIRRLMAEEGLFFWFDHSFTNHKMVISDAPLAMPMIDEAPMITYNAQTGGQTRGSYIRNFKQKQRVRSTDLHQKDYTFKKPAYGQDQKHVKQETAGEDSQYAIYDYPGRYKDAGQGKPFTQYKLEAERVSANIGMGQTNNIHLCPGFNFNLSDHPSAKANILHRVLQVQHKGTQPAALQEDAPSGDGYATRYDADFQTMPQRLPYRPINPNPKPQILGSQIAIVTGPAGEEIYCDEHGRVKVHFPWDRHNKKDEHSSCWIRVSQNWAGGTWGHIAIPRIGHEVIVDFLEGDPDQPIITGRTYHATNMSTYPLPKHKTKMVIRSDTHKGSGFNEMSFEDEAGQENIALHAQKDQTLKVLHNRMKRVDNDQVESVGRNKNVEVGNNHHETIGGSMSLSVGAGGLGLIAGMAALIGKSAKDALNVAEEAGNPLIPTFLAGVAAAMVAEELMSNPKISGFSGAGNNAKIAGADQVSAGEALGSVLSKIMPLSGVKNSVIEKIQSDTIGIARTEQIGAFKNTLVGAVQNINVGMKQFTKIGEEQRLDVGKIKTVDVGQEYVTHAGKKSGHSSGKLFTISSQEKFEGSANVWEIKANDTLLLSTPGGYIEMSKSGIKIRGKKVEIEGNAIDFKSGGPGEGSKCLRAMAESATPFVR